MSRNGEYATTAVMDAASFALFLAVFIVAAASPGPAIAAIVGRVLGRGLKGIAPFLGGLILGDIVWLTLAIFGLSVLAQTFHTMFLAIKYLGVAYLLWLAFKLWTAPAAGMADDARPTDMRGIVGGVAAGLALSLGNPKTMLFYVALLPTILDLNAITPLAYVELSVVIAAFLVVIFGAYALAAAKARRLFKSPRAMRFMNRTSGAVMAGAAAAVAAR